MNIELNKLFKTYTHFLIATFKLTEKDDKFDYVPYFELFKNNLNAIKSRFIRVDKRISSVGCSSARQLFIFILHQNYLAVKLELRTCEVEKTKN